MSPRTSKQFEEIRVRSREKILTAALELFAQEGFQNVSVSQISVKAGVSKGLLYNYFTSKEDVLTAIIDMMMQDMFGFVVEIGQETDPAKKLEKLVRISFRLFREKKELYTMIMPLITQRAVSEKIHGQLSAFFGEFVTELEKTFTELKVKNPRMEAYHAGALIDGIAWHYLFLFPDNYPLDEMENHIVDHVKSLI